MSTSSICILFVNIMHTWTWTYALLHLSVSVCDSPPTAQRVNILASCVSNCGTLLLGRPDCIIGGKATTLTWAYNGIVVRQGSRFLGLPKAIAQSFSWSHPYLTFIRTKTPILQFWLIREGFDIKDMKNLHSPLQSGNERRFQFEVTPHIILSWRNSDIGMWATWDLSMFISCPKNWNKNLHEHMSFPRDSSQGWLPVPGQNFGHCL